MEVKSGYKQTEVGVIPKDWDTPELGGILKSMQLGGNYKNNERETSWPLIKMGNLGRGSIKLEKLEFIDSSQPPASRDRLRKNDVLFNTRNTLDLVGKVAIWRDELPEAYFNSNIMRMEFNEVQVSSKHFMNYILNTPQLLKSLRGIAIGTTSVAAIYSRDLVKVTVPLPTKAEQEAITAILSDADSLIESLEQLITKKCHLKHGAMQELLTGKKRLPGYSGEWEVMRLGGLITIITAGIYGEEKMRDGMMPYPVATTAHIDEDDTWNNKEMTVRYFSPEQIRRYSSFDGDLIIVKSSGSAEKIQSGKIGFVDSDMAGKFLFSNFLMLLRPTSIVPRFLYFYLCSYNVKKLLPMLVEASTYPNIRIDEYLNLEIPTPIPDEQTAIASVLSDIDAEIAALKTKLAKARQLKQGMMQELLTGKTRLI